MVGGCYYFLHLVSSFRKLLSFVDIFLGLLVFNFWKNCNKTSRKCQQFNTLFSRTCSIALVMSLMNFYTFCISCNVSLCSHQVIKEDLERAYKNTNMKPMSHSTYLRLQVLREIFWDVDKKLELLMKLTFTDLVAFVPKILSQVLLCFILFSLQSFYTFLLCEN